MTDHSERKPVVAGQFYPREERNLRRLIAQLMPQKAAPQETIAVVMPHAGYVYSGRVAARTIARAIVPAAAIVIGPNHTGQGGPFSLMARGCWQTPLGTVKIDEALADALQRESDLISVDLTAHMFEHAIEVELPFLQYCRPEVLLVPLVVSDFRLEHYRAVGEAIARAVRQHTEQVLVVASSDFSHYEPQAAAQRKDKLAIDQILALDPARLIEVVQKERISMCGFAPVAVALFAARALGAVTAELVDYQTSGDVSGDYDKVVGYAGITIR